MNFIAARGGNIASKASKKKKGRRIKEMEKKPLILSSQIRRFIFTVDYRCSGENNGTEQLKFSLTIGLHGILARKRGEKKRKEK